MLYKVIHTLVDSGIKEIQIVLGGNSVGDIVKLVGSGKGFGEDVKVSYVFQDRAGGIAEALSLTEKFVNGDKCAVILGDNIFEDDFSSWVEEFRKDYTNECYLFLKEVGDPHRFGVAEIEEDRIKNIVEKPKEPKSNWAVSGMYFYHGNVFDIIKQVIDRIGYSQRGELEISDVNQMYVDRGTVRGIKLTGFWSDAGKFETLIKSANFVASKKSDKDE
jgi:glucose-1-phosphate thymidylyltransferase